MPRLQRRKVIAAIPHYNMPETLVALLQQVLAQGYDAVYVLDDNSTVCDIAAVLDQFGSKLQLVRGSQNVGAGRNRNRILQVEPELLKGSILHFLDADVRLLTQDIPAKARVLCADETVGQIGGLIMSADGVQYMHNYNPRISWTWAPESILAGAIGVLSGRHKRLGRFLRQLFRRPLRDFPDVLAKPVARDVFCVAEANFLVPYDVFAAVGGFSDKLRFQEAMDFAYRLEVQGLRRRFDPTVAVEHLAVQVRGRRRAIENWNGVWSVAREHGLPLK